MLLKKGTRVSLCLAASVLLLGLHGCGGGGGGGGGGTASSLLTVVPSLGQFKPGAPVHILDKNGNLLRQGTIGDDGRVRLDLGAYNDVVIVEVRGGSGVRYFNEATGSDVEFPAGAVLRAVLPPGLSSTAVTPLTHAAAERLNTSATGFSLGANATAAKVLEENTRIALQFGLSDVLAAPALIGKSDDKLKAADGEAAIYALILAGLSKYACPSTVSCMPAHEAAAALAKDLKDGSLDGKSNGINTGLAIDTNDLKAKIFASVNDFVADADQTLMEAMVQSIYVDVDTPTLTDEQRDALAQAGTDLAQAKRFFADLRTGVLPYFNPAGTGFLDDQGKVLEREVRQIQFASHSALDIVGALAEWIGDIQSQGTAWGCTGSSGVYDCEHYGWTIRLTQQNANTWQWQVLHVTPAMNGTVNIPTSNNYTFNGDLPALTLWRPGGYAPVRTQVQNVALQVTALPGDIVRYSFQGSMQDVDSVGRALFKMEMQNGSFIEEHDPSNPAHYDPSKAKARILGIFMTANYRLDGRLEFGELQSKNNVIVGGKGKFTGTISGSGVRDNNPNNNFKLLQGELDINVDGRNFNPLLSTSATNYLTGSLTFTGQTFLSATDPGLRLVLSIGVTGWQKGNYAITYTDRNKLVSLTASGDYDDNSPTPQSVTFRNGSGIEVFWAFDEMEATVRKGTTRLGTIRGTRITYVDGTFASLY